MTRISHNREFRIFGGILITISTEFHNFSTITYFRLDLSDVFPFSGATVCKAMTFQLHRMDFCHSGMINIISQNELSPVLIRVFPSRYQHLDSKKQELVSFPVQHNGMKEVE